MHDDFSERRPHNAVTDFVDANVARGLRDKIAFIDPDRSLTYGDLQTRSIRFANALRELGVEHEHRVALLMNDTVDYPVAFWGAIRAGAIAIPLNTYLPVPQYAYILADCRARVLVVDAALVESIWPLLDKLALLKTVIIVGEKSSWPGERREAPPSRLKTRPSTSSLLQDVDAIGSRARPTAELLRAASRVNPTCDDKRVHDGKGTASLNEPGHDGKVHDFETLIAKADATPVTADTLSDEAAFWLYTSGSTGDPKGVKHVHSNLMATATLFGHGILGIREDDVVHSASKLFFAYGLGNAMTFPLSVGATAVLWPHRPSPEGVFEMIRRHRVSIFYGVPSLYTALLSHKDICKGAGSDRLRICVSAGEALPAHIGERWHDVVGVDVLDGLGSTEMLNTFLSNRPGDIRYGSTGKPVPGYDTRIVDEHGREVGTGEIGELIVRGPSAGEGYWNQRGKSRRTFAGEWTLYRRQIPLRCRRLLLLLRAHRRHVQGERHVGVAVRCRGGAGLARGGAGSRRHRQGRCRRADQAEGLHCPQERLQGGRRPARDIEGARQGQGGAVEVSALDRASYRAAAHRNRQDPAVQIKGRGSAIAGPVADHTPFIPAQAEIQKQQFRKSPTGSVGPRFRGDERREFKHSVHSRASGKSRNANSGLSDWRRARTNGTTS